MEEHDNLLEKLNEILGRAGGNLKILEQQIDMDLQVAYFDCSKKVREEVDEEQAMENSRYLNEPGYSLQVKKEILARLASISRVECYRIIESFLASGEEELREWTIMALNESRMHLESDLLDENQVFISTGLGGRQGKLRYFVVLITRDKLEFSETQKKVIRNEFDFTLGSYEAEIEEMEFSGHLARLLLLLPLQQSVGPVFREAIRECNQYGDFLEEEFIVTNVKKLTFPEIIEFLERKRPGSD